MKKRLTQAEARAFRARWTAVNQAERAELRATPTAHKFQQLAALMASIAQLGWTQELAAEETAVRERWNRLRNAVRG